MIELSIIPYQKEQDKRERDNVLAPFKNHGTVYACFYFLGLFLCNAWSLYFITQKVTDL